MEVSDLMVHYSKIVNGLIAYIDQDMVQKMNGSWKAWAVGTVAALIARRADAVFRELRDNKVVQVLGIIDGEMVDIDSIYAELLKQAQTRSATINMPLMGSVTYSSQDVEALYRLIVG